MFDDTVPSYIMTCHNCGHGSDLRGCPQSAMVIEGILPASSLFPMPEVNDKHQNNC